MINSLAKSDIRKLRDDGIILTDDDIITLNDCANSASKETVASDIVTAPRIGWCNDTAIYEPTQQSEYWCAFYACKWFATELSYLEKATGWIFRRKLPSMAYARAFSLANARTVGFFDGLMDRKQAILAVTNFVISLNATDEELMTACLYASNGGCISAESGEALEAVHDEIAKGRTQSCPYTKIVEDALESGLGLSIAELKALSAGELYRITSKFVEFKIASSGIGRFDKAQIKKALHDAKFAEYILLLAEIRKRGSKK